MMVAKLNTKSFGEAQNITINHDTLDLPTTNDCSNRIFILYTLYGVYLMSKQPLSISEEAKVQMPMKTVASLIALVAIGTWAFFGIQEKLNQQATQLKIMEKDLVENTEFRIKWPRGLLGSLPR